MTANQRLRGGGRMTCQWVLGSNESRPRGVMWDMVSGGDFFLVVVGDSLADNREEREFSVWSGVEWSGVSMRMSWTTVATASLALCPDLFRKNGIWSVCCVVHSRYDL